MRTSIIKILVIFRIISKSWYRNKSSLFWTLVFPILLMGIFGTVFNTENSQFELNVQNLDIDELGNSTYLSNELIRALNSTQTLILKETKTNSDELSNLLIIPKGFQENSKNGESEITLINDRAQSSSSAVYNIVSGIINEFNIELSGAQRMIKIREDSTVSPSLKYIDFFVPGVLGMTIMVTGIFGTIGINTKYKQNKVLKKLATAPISKLDWILGLILYQMIMALISSAIILTSGYLIFGVKVALNIPTILLMLSGAITFPGMAMIITRFVSEEEAANAAGNALSFPMMFLSGTFWPIESMPELLRIIASILPLTYINEGLRDSMIRTDLSSSMSNFAIVLPIGIAAIITGSILMTWKED